LRVFIFQYIHLFYLYIYRDKRENILYKIFLRDVILE